MNFNLYLLDFLKDAKLSSNSLILFKKYLSGVVNFQCFIPIDGKIINNKIFLIKFTPICLINIGLVGRRVREYVKNY